MPEQADTIVVGKGGLTFVDGEGRRLMTLRAGPRGPVLALLDEGGNEAVRLGLTADGGSVAVGRGPDRAAAMEAFPSGGAVVVSGAGGAPAAAVSAHPGGGFVNVSDPSGAHVGVLGVDGGDGVLLVKSRAGVNTFAVPAWRFTTGAAGTPDGAEQAPPSQDGKE